MQSAKLGMPLDTIEASEYLKISVGTLKRWRRLGCGPRFIKTGGIVRYQSADLDAFMAAYTVASPDAASEGRP